MVVLLAIGLSMVAVSSLPQVGFSAESYSHTVFELDDTPAGTDTVRYNNLSTDARTIVRVGANQTERIVTERSVPEFTYATDNDHWNFVTWGNSTYVVAAHVSSSFPVGTVLGDPGVTILGAAIALAGILLAIRH
ncbi:MAG: hypothetical protein ABEJ42_01135 [Halobacteriaceae archaeon]